MTSKKKKPAAVEVAVYDRALLEHHEVQPVATEDGHTITVDSMGRFGAIMGEVTVNEPTLEKAKEKVHTNHMAQERKRRRKTIAVPCFIYDKGGMYAQNDDMFVGAGFFRGVHAGNGRIQYAQPDGTKGSSESVYLWAPGHSDADRVEGLAHRQAKLYAESKEVGEELDELCKAQKARMYGVELGWMRNRPRLKNNTDEANAHAEMIVANVLEGG